MLEDREQGSDEDQLLTWALDYIFFETRKALRLQPDPKQAVTLVRSRMRKYLTAQLLRKVGEPATEVLNLDAVEGIAYKSQQSVEPLVESLQLKPKQQNLLLKVLYQRDGESVNSLFADTNERDRWYYLREQLQHTLSLPKGDCR